MNRTSRHIAARLALLAFIWCFVESPAAWADPPAPPAPDDEPPAPEAPPAPNKPADEVAPARHSERLRQVSEDDTQAAPPAPDQPDDAAQHAAAYAAQRKEPISTFRYVAGGLIGTLYGFGIGHAIIGEYASTGWFYTLTEATAAGVIIYGSYRAYGIDDHSSGTIAILASGSIALVFLRALEVHDLWTRPEVASLEPDTDTAFAVGPSVTDDSLGAMLQLRW